MSEPIEVEVAGRIVNVTSPDKVFFQARGDTKLDLIAITCQSRKRSCDR